MTVNKRWVIYFWNLGTYKPPHQYQPCNAGKQESVMLRVKIGLIPLSIRNGFFKHCSDNFLGLSPRIRCLYSSIPRVCREPGPNSTLWAPPQHTGIPQGVGATPRPPPLTLCHFYVIPRKTTWSPEVRWVVGVGEWDGPHLWLGINVMSDNNRGERR